jgi:hypothetical protein
MVPPAIESCGDGAPVTQRGITARNRSADVCGSRTWSTGVVESGASMIIAATPLPATIHERTGCPVATSPSRAPLAGS